MSTWNAECPKCGKKFETVHDLNHVCKSEDIEQYSAKQGTSSVPLNGTSGSDSETTVKTGNAVKKGFGAYNLSVCDTCQASGIPPHHKHCYGCGREIKW